MSCARVGVDLKALVVNGQAYPQSSIVKNLTESDLGTNTAVFVEYLSKHAFHTGLCCVLARYEDVVACKLWRLKVQE